MLTVMTMRNEERESKAVDLLSLVLEQEHRVVRAEAVLAAAKRRLSWLQARFGRLGQRLYDVAEACAEETREARPAVPSADGTTMRERILALLAASPAEVFTPAMLAPAVGAGSRDSVRNTLLVLASKGRIEKLGPGRYRARQDA